MRTMNAVTETEIAVIGAGVVGQAVALRLAQAGHAVLTIAPEDPGDGASYGNAGVIADYAVLPVGTPDVLRTLPALLFDRMSPLAIRRAALPTLAPWLIRFAWQSLPGQARRNAQAIAALLAESAAEWRALAADIDASGLIRQRGSLYLYDTARALGAARAELAWRKAHGVRVDLIGAAALGQLEPGLPSGVAEGAAFFPDTMSVSDPGRMLAHLAHATTAAGVARMFLRATGLRRRAGGVEIETEAGRVHARRAVIAAGAFSRPLALAAGDRVPLETERGYHLEFDMAELPVSRPLTPVSRGFYFCPMQGRLRVAGTVELGGLDAPPSPHRLARLEEGARAVLPDLPAPDRSWMGFRPSVPDSVPVIGPSRAGPEVLMAFGHGHLGLTLAPVTARLIADLVAGKPQRLPLHPYRPGRF
jgi:glycine/D-amino acid oxidase-like deaminating enzyme